MTSEKITESVYCTVEEAMTEIQEGRMIILTDRQDRENEGDFFIPASLCRTEHINLMASRGKGLICVPLSRAKAEQFGLSLMIKENANALHGTAFTQSVDAIADCKSGISCGDRSTTVSLLASNEGKPDDLARPGHIFPIIEHPGGLECRDGHTEAAVELCRVTGQPEAGVICEILSNDGTMARGKELELLAKQCGMKILTIDILKKNREIGGKIETVLPQDEGKFNLSYYPSSESGCDIIALVRPGWTGRPLVRLHSECLTGEALGSSRCDCGQQLEQARKMILREGGVLLYMRQEGRGIGLKDKLRAYALQDQGMDTFEANLALGHRADERNYSGAAEILQKLGLQDIRLLTNNPDKISALEEEGITVERVPLEVGVSAETLSYMRTKKERMGHLLREVV